MRLAAATLAAVLALLSPWDAGVHAEVLRVEVTHVADVLNARARTAGAPPYELIEGRVYFTLDPLAQANAAIADIALAPRDAGGRVTFSADLAIMRPKGTAAAPGAVLFDAGAAGRRSLFAWFDRGDRASLSRSATYVGDDFLLRQRLTLVWLGRWQNLPDARGLLRLEGPRLDGVTGWVRGDLTVAQRTLDVALGGGGLPYPVLDPQADDSQLAITGSRTQPPRTIPGTAWAFARIEGGMRVADNTRIVVDGGFVPGARYQYAYRAAGPPVAGLGFAAVRDLMAWLRHDPAALALGRGQQFYAFGAGEGARFLRQFLDDGFNSDAAGRRVFDGVMLHGAGAAERGFNERFGRPLHDFATQAVAAGDEVPAEREEAGGFNRRAAMANSPRLIYTTTSWDYWGEGASASHTTAKGEDAPLPAGMRLYHFASTAGLPAALPLADAAATHSQLPQNPVDFRYGLRALLVMLEAWVRDGVEPPVSCYPTVAEKGLVPYLSFYGSALYGVGVPMPRPLYLTALGADEALPQHGRRYEVMVPQVDMDGNELSGIRLPMITTPLAAHTGWNPRAPSIGAPRELLDGEGASVTFPRSRFERAPNDERAVVLDRYASRADYLKRIADDAAQLLEQRLLLEEDIPFMVRDAQALWEQVMQAGPPDAAPAAPAVPAAE